MKTWTIEVETKAGMTKRLTWAAKTLAEAIDLTIEEVSVVNILRAWRGGRRVL